MITPNRNLCRKVTTAAAFAASVATFANCIVAQESQTNTSPNVEARIRLRESVQRVPVTQSPDPEYHFAPIPTIPQDLGAANNSPIQQVSAQVPVETKSEQGVRVASLPMTATLATALAKQQNQNGQAVAIQDENAQEISGLPGMRGSVRIVPDRENNKLIVIGDDADVAIVEKAIDEMLDETKDEIRFPERIPLKYSSSEDVVESIREIYDGNYATKTGSATIGALKSPNALLVFGSSEAIKAVRDIVGQIESDVIVEEGPDFASFRLKHISAGDAKRRLESLFSGSENVDAGMPPTAATVVADYRSNTVVVRGNPQVVQQAKLLIQAIDVDEDIAATKAVRVFQLENAVASDLAVILQDAITGSFRNIPEQLQGNAQQGGGLNQAQGAQPADEFSSEPAPTKLKLQTIGGNGDVTSGILFDVRITPDTSSNSIVVNAPTSAMPLIEELVKQLDRLPNAETVIKVFPIVNGDAQQLLDMLQQIFGADVNQQGGGNQFGGQAGSLQNLPLQTAAASPGSALINLRFAIDQRTNSIIATGPSGELQVVEDLLNRLDEDQRSRRQTIVYRLSNANVLDVEESLNSLLDTRDDRNSNDPRTSGLSVQADKQVVVVPEVGSNSLIISALPENFPEIEEIIKRLDRRPPMVKVKVMLAEVDLNTVEEFGVELGLQDSLLFDRSTTIGVGNALTGDGFEFNNANSANTNAVFPGTFAGRALSNLNVGRVNSELGYGGLVLSAGNESVNVLLRALKDRNCLRVLSKPQIMTMENLQGRVSVGQSVPRITDSTQTINGGISNGVEERDVGVILEITPRVSPDGMIVMFVNVVSSSLGSEESGVAVAVDNNGNVVNQAPINATEAQTAIMSRSGQTIVFSGLIQETKSHFERGAPILSDLPVIGPLFKFEGDQARRTELLIIMTPYLVDSEGAIEAQNADEMERMHWCLQDVAEIYGNTDFDPVHFNQGAIRTVYPDQDPMMYETSGIDPSLFENTLETVVQDVQSTPNVNAEVAKVAARVARANPPQNSIAEKPVTTSSKSRSRKSLFSKVADKLRGNNVPNRNDRNRSDFEDLKKLNKQR
jgi:type II secretion system protein D